MNEEYSYDLLATVKEGGCSAKLPADKLSELLSDIPMLKDANIMVDIETHDDAGVYRLNDDVALIVTTDFFPPVCSSPLMFGRIAAANSLSDVYAMGGVPLLVLNLNMFPSGAPLEALRDILLGGQEKINEAGAFVMGGHTIEDATPKYGLAVVGTVSPEKLVTNSGARPGDVLILTKPIGTGVLIAAHRMGLDTPEGYKEALDSMSRLNNDAAEVMRNYNIKGATDITGFGLAGHLIKMLEASDCSAELYAEEIPLICGVEELLSDGCVPGTTFRNKNFVGDRITFAPSISVERRLSLFDAQTSGGILMSVPESISSEVLTKLREKYPVSSIIGKVSKSNGTNRIKVSRK